MLRSKGLLGLLCVCSALCVGLCIATRVPALGQNADDAAATIKARLEQKRDVLKQRLEAFEVLVKSGNSTPDATLAARDDLLDAELALATDKPQRIAVLERKLDNAKQYESVLTQQRGNGRALLTDSLMATARRLDAEIALLRERE
jgi:hypothetical protein